MTILEAWEQATEQAANLFANAAGMTRGSNGNFFLDHFPPTTRDAAALYVSGGSDNVPWLGDAAPTAVNMDWRIEGRFRERRDAMRFAAVIMKSLPVKQDGNILAMQPTSVPSIEGKYFKVLEGDRPQLLFAVDVGGRVVFRVG